MYFPSFICYTGIKTFAQCRKRYKVTGISAGAESITIAIEIHRKEKEYGILLKMRKETE